MNGSGDMFLKYCDAEWNVSGLFSHDDSLIYLYDLFSSVGIRIFHSVHGCTPCQWNSGRAIRRHSEKYIKECLEAYQKRSIPIFLTFSNYFITHDMLSDVEGNDLLKKISYSSNNGVIISSPVLKSYIKKQFPQLKIYSSILNVVHFNGKGSIEFYESSKEAFDRVVLHPDDCIDIAFLKKLKDKKSYEVIVNENCVRNCPYRHLHEDMVCDFFKHEREKIYFDRMLEFTHQNCQSFYDNTMFSQYLFGNLKNCNLTDEELAKVYELGFRNFKIQGRNDSVATFIFDILRLILKKPQADLIYRFVMNKISDTPYKDSLVHYM